MKRIHQKSQVQTKSQLPKQMSKIFSLFPPFTSPSISHRPPPRPRNDSPKHCKTKPPQSRRLNSGTPWGIRTLDLQIRNLMLYPAELRAQRHLFYTIFYKIQAPSPIRHKTISQQQPFSICAIQKTYKYLRTRTKSASLPDILPSQPHLPRERTSISPPFPAI